MKKKIVLGVLGVMVVGLLAACGGATSSGDATAESADASGDIVYDALDYVELGDYLGVEVTSVKYEATQDDYDEYLSGILEGEAYHAESDKTVVEDGDLISLDYSGVQTESGEEIDSSEDYELEIGSDTFIDDFEDQLIGTTVGEEVVVEVTFPDDYSSEDLQGVDATFTCTVNAILEADETVPEYTDDFVNEYTEGEYTTTADYDEYIWSEITATAESDTESALQSAVQEAVYACCTCTSLPDGLLDQQFAEYKESDQASAESYGYEFEDYILNYYGYASEEEYDEALTEYLEGYLEQKLIQEAIAEKEGWDEITEEDTNAFLEEYAVYYGYETAEDFLTAYGFEDSASFIEYVGEEDFNAAVVQLKVWDKLTEAANVTYTEETEETDEELEVETEE
ncbi:MAG: FKBP-type peptidyl-prolyl cis-trans isomerase [Eubacterium sp.]|nr:FKBP-type peptidyl-prolyl cis-trans isomerase [Eubacterium sp.]